MGLVLEEFDRLAIGFKGEPVALLSDTKHL